MELTTYSNCKKEFISLLTQNIQLALYGIPAVIIHGNSLTVEEWSHWFTPALFRAVAAEERPELEAVSVTA